MTIMQKKKAYNSNIAPVYESDASDQEPTVSVFRGRPGEAGRCLDA